MSSSLTSHTFPDWLFYVVMLVAILATLAWATSERRRRNGRKLVERILVAARRNTESGAVARGLLREDVTTLVSEENPPTLTTVAELIMARELDRRYPPESDDGSATPTESGLQEQQQPQ